MKDKILEIQREKTLCEIYTDFEATSKYAVGYIRSCDVDYTIVEMYDPYGHYDGIGCFLTDSIYEIEIKTEYLNSLNKLIAHYKEKSKFVTDEISDIEHILSLLKSRQRVCEIELCESHNVDVVGLIVDFNRDYITITNLDKYGKPDGEATVRRESISQLSFDSSDTIKIEILRN